MQKILFHKASKCNIFLTDIIFTGITNAIIICVLLITILNIRAVVTNISSRIRISVVLLQQSWKFLIRKVVLFKIEHTWEGLEISGQLSQESPMPSLSESLSQALPMPSPSESSCPEFGVVMQLSLVHLVALQGRSMSG